LLLFDYNTFLYYNMIMTIREYLEKHHWSRAKFAQKAGVIEKAVGHWVTGERKPKPDIALKIIKFTKGKITFKDIYG
jgi:DNA-binding XRE family transcriptional regulator